ncbi:MAG: MarR family transcriptional regulator [Clostridiaceae bacterium]|nr:MarR family transcriptional regulator [Clostridiaceae bacterium]
MDIEYVTDLLLNNLKKLFFPEEWLSFDLEFSKTEMFSLLLIEKKKEIIMTELAEYINSPLSTATGIINRLVKDGYIIRERSEQDRRIVLLKLSEKGVKEVKRLKELVGEYMNKVVDKLTQEEIQFMDQIARKILNILTEEHVGQQANQQNENAVRKIEID